MDSNFWLDVLDENAGRWILPEEWEGDTTKYIKALKDKAPNKQTKTYLDGLLKHLKDEGFLSDEQKGALANITKGTKGGSDSDGGDAKSTSKDTSKSKSKDTSSKDDDDEDTKDEPEEKKKKVKGETGKEIKKQIGSLLGKLGGIGKDLASKVDSKAVGAIEQGVAGGANVKDAVKGVIDKMKEDSEKKKEEKELEKKKKEEKKKIEQAKKKGVKKESFGYKFKEYLMK